MTGRQQTAPPQQRHSKDTTAHPHQPGTRPEPPHPDPAHSRRQQPNSGNGCCTKNCARPWTGGGGRGRVWEGCWGLYKGPQRPPASRISSPTATHTRVQPYIGLFPLDACLRPLQRGGRGQGYRVPTALVITPRARVESQRGELRTGTGIRLWVSGLSHISAFPAQSVPLPTPKRRAGAGLVCPDSVGYQARTGCLAPMGTVQSRAQC